MLKNSPGRIARVRSWTTRSPPKVLETLLSSTSQVVCSVTAFNSAVCVIDRDLFPSDAVEHRGLPKGVCIVSDCPKEVQSHRVGGILGAMTRFRPVEGASGRVRPV